MFNSKIDIIITSGAVAGKYDFVPNVIKNLKSLIILKVLL